MAEDILVERKIEAADNLLSYLQANGFDIAAACWVKEESGLWYLYIASRIVDANGASEAYRELSRLLRKNSNPWIDPFEIKLIKTDEPLAKEIQDLHRRYPELFNTRNRLRELGGMNVGEARIYPPVLSTP